jgi:hypothetical protein
MSDEPPISQQAQGSYIAQAAHGGSATVNVVLPPVSLTEKQRKQNCTRMLERVQAIWIKGVLEPSMQGAAQIALELEHKPSAVVTPLWQEVREFDTTGRLSSVESSIVQVYDHANGEVLILGEPGAGKTTLLLELTRDLLERARQDETHPIPVVFSLSSWAAKRQPLAEWLASELHTRYQVPLPLATSWIETDQVLPLLDGLDEVAAPHRAACVEAINVYRKAHGLLPTVVCCRQADYLVLSTRLLLRTAVVVQPLTPEQIESYLTSGGERLEALRQTLREDADLRALASTPLMLNVLTVVYQGTLAEKITATGSPGMKQERVFAFYVQRMLTRRNISERYTPRQTIHWLSYLADQMKRQSQTVFYIEHMQPNWLSGTRMFRAYGWWAVRLPGVLIGILVSLAINTFLITYIDLAYFVTSLFLGGLIGGILSEGSIPQRPAGNSEKVRSIPCQQFLLRLLAGILIGFGIGLSNVLGYVLGYVQMVRSGFGPSYVLSSYELSDVLRKGLLSGLLSGLLFGACSILLQVFLVKSNTVQSTSQTLPTFWRLKWQHLIRSTSLRNGLHAGLLVGLGFGLSYALSYALGLSYEVTLFPKWLVFGLLFGLLFGLIAWFLSLLLIGKSMTVQLTDRLTWSWTSLGRSLRSSQHVRVTLLIVALVGLICTTITGLILGLGGGLIMGLIIGPSIGLIYWLLIGLFQGVSSETIGDQQRMAPNQGIRRSAFNGFVFGCISAVSIGLASRLIFGLGVSPSIGLDVGLIFGLSVGLLVFLLKGGLAYLRHYVLRYLLWRTGSIPWHYVSFLDYAAGRILLRKVGGGYIFLHRLLLDYFADQETGPVSDETGESRQERLQPDMMPSVSMEPAGADEHSNALAVPLVPTSILSDVPRMLPCGHELRTLSARFCSVCGASITMADTPT